MLEIYFSDCNDMIKIFEKILETNSDYFKAMIRQIYLLLIALSFCKIKYLKKRNNLIHTRVLFVVIIAIAKSKSIRPV